MSSEINGFHLPQLVVFDWDNTLVENWTALTAAMNVALAAFNLPSWDVARMMDNSRQSMRNSFPGIFGENWEKAREIFYADFRKHHLPSLKRIEGAAELLDFLNQHGVIIAVCSNKNGDLLRREAKHLGWTHYFTCLVGAQDAEKDKPDPAPVRLIRRVNHLPAVTPIWFVGDTSADMICARRSNCLPVGIGPFAGEDPVYQPRLHFSGLGPLLTGLKTLLSSSVG